MNRVIALVGLTVCWFFLFSCGHDPSRKQPVATEAQADNESATGNAPLINVVTQENNTSISFDTVTFQVPAQLNIAAENIFNGIYEWKSDSLIRRKILILKNLAFLTTFEDLGRGIRSNLYVFDLAQKSLIKDSSFKRVYLHSSAGIFMIDANNGKIFVIGKSEWYDAKKELITGASFYEVSSGYFHFDKNVYKEGELGVDTIADSTIISFYKMATTGEGVYALPDDWWRVK
jgi:hypothetical protein